MNNHNCHQNIESNMCEPHCGVCKKDMNREKKKRILDKLGLEGSISEQHAKDILEILEQEIKQTEEAKLKEIVEIIEEDFLNKYTGENSVREFNTTQFIINKIKTLSTSNPKKS